MILSYRVGKIAASPPSIPKTTSQSLQQQMPGVYGRLLEIRERLERHYGDVCDIEFTIQEGNLFILNVRPARRTPRANLKFLLQFLGEGKIGIREVLSRVRLEDIEDTCRPDVLNLGRLRSLGRGIPACPGTATGVISFQASDALRRSRRGEKVLFVREEVSPDDAEAISASQGVLTSRGGMTSHAALICRGWAKPCVIGFEPMQLRPKEKALFVSSYGLLRAGKWITVDGNTGEVYAGRAERTQPSWKDQRICKRWLKS